MKTEDRITYGALECWTCACGCGGLCDTGLPCPLIYNARHGLRLRPGDGPGASEGNHRGLGHDLRPVEIRLPKKVELAWNREAEGEIMGDGDLIAIFEVCEPEDDEGKATHAEQVRLLEFLCAAPDLLAALESVVAILGEEGTTKNGPVRRAHDIAAAAIAKARGKA